MEPDSNPNDSGKSCCGLLLLAIVALISLSVYVYNQNAQREKRRQMRTSHSRKRRASRRHSSANRMVSEQPLIELPPAQVVQEPLAALEDKSSTIGEPTPPEKKEVTPLTQKQVDALPQDEQMKYFDCWLDVNSGVNFNERVRHPVKALNRALQIKPGVYREEYVALWYKHGEPVSGAMWPNENGLVMGSFVSHGSEHTNNLGSMQVLTYNAATAPFKISWQPYSVASTKGSGWYAVRVNNTAPCVIPLENNCERLGKVQLSEEMAAVGVDGKEIKFTGPAVQNMMVLCRDSPVPGALYDVEDAKRATSSATVTSCSVNTPK